MTPTTRTEPAETLEERAARAQGELQAVYAEQERLDAEQAERHAQAQAAFDVELVAAWNPAELDADVLTARRAVAEAVAEHALTKVVAAYYIAAGRRHQRWNQYLAALGRQGRSTADLNSAQVPRIQELPSIADLIDREGQNIGHDWRTTDAADHEQTRTTTPKDNHR